jgi:galactokinase
MDHLLQTGLSSSDMASICRAAEHEYAGVPCGIMDPLCIASCNAGHCLRLDCRTESVVAIPIDAPEVVFLIADTGVHRRLNAEGYAARRHECEAAARIIGVSLLADVTARQLAEIELLLSEQQGRRVRHVVHEMDRVRRGELALRQKQWTEFGRLMNESHESLRDLFDVSCPELDAMVQTANELEGVFGSRMTGAGFGGCTIHLVARPYAARVAARLAEGYVRQIGIQPDVFVSPPSAGAGVVDFRRSNRGLAANR